MTKIGVVGLGKLGLPLSLCLNKAHDVVGVDINQQTVDAINNKTPLISEPGVVEALEEKALRATTDYEALRDRELVVCLTATPSNSQGRFSNKYVLQVIDELNSRQISPRVFSVTSTVMPGSSREFQHHLKHSDVVYNPEFIALGSVMSDVMHPDFVLIGSEKKEAGDLVERVYREMFGETQEQQEYDDSRGIGAVLTPRAIHRTNWVNAEISKMALNSYVTMKINFANMLAELCERKQDGDVDEVTRIIGSDRRIGSRYLRGGTSYGGTCFPRDNRAFKRVLNDAGVDSRVLEDVDTNNEAQTSRLVRKVADILGVRQYSDDMLLGRKITIYGKAFKPGTTVDEESAGVKLADKLRAIGARVEITDDANPYSMSGSALTIFMLPDRRYQAITPADIRNYMEEPRVLDCWRERKDLATKPEIDYHTLGRWRR